MSKDLYDFLETNVAIHEMQAGTVGKVWAMMVSLGLSDGSWGTSQSSRAWALMYYMASYAKKPLRDKMSSPDAYDLLISRLTADKQKYP